jgi:hypothetical protein
MKLSCSFRLPGDPWHPTKILDNIRVGTLTTEHAASTFALPVVVETGTGRAYGSAEIEGGEISLSREWIEVVGHECVEHPVDDAAFDQAVAAAKAAGYKVVGH